MIRITLHRALLVLWDLGRARHTTWSQPPEALGQGIAPPVLWEVAAGPDSLLSGHLIPAWGGSQCKVLQVGGWALRSLLRMVNLNLVNYHSPLGWLHDLYI